MPLWRNLEPSELTRPTNCECLPQVVEADGARSLVELCAVVTAERNRLRDEMLKRGGILLRGFEVNEPAGFAEIIGAPWLNPRSTHTAPRSAISRRADFRLAPWPIESGPTTV